MYKYLILLYLFSLLFTGVVLSMPNSLAKSRNMADKNTERVMKNNDMKMTTVKNGHKVFTDGSRNRHGFSPKSKVVIRNIRSKNIHINVNVRIKSVTVEKKRSHFEKSKHISREKIFVKKHRVIEKKTVIKKPVRISKKRFVIERNRFFFVPRTKKIERFPVKIEPQSQTQSQSQTVNVLGATSSPNGSVAVNPATPTELPASGSSDLPLALLVTGAVISSGILVRNIRARLIRS